MYYVCVSARGDTFVVGGSCEQGGGSRGARATTVAAATRRALYYNTTEPRERVMPRVGGELIKIAAVAAACE